MGLIGKDRPVVMRYECDDKRGGVGGQTRSE